MFRRQCLEFQSRPRIYTELKQSGNAVFPYCRQQAHFRFRRAPEMPRCRRSLAVRLTEFDR